MRIAATFSSVAHELARSTAAGAFVPLPALGEPAGRSGDVRGTERRGEIVRRDSATLSPESLELAARQGEERVNAIGDAEAGEREQGHSFDAEAEEGEATGVPARADELSADEQQAVRELAARDREVRAHEQAHKSAAGELATSGPTYEYETGPDGRQYAVGGEVGISLREGRTPEESLRLARQARSAALAPAEPSGQDRAVAAEAARMEAQAQAELREEREASGEGEATEAASAGASSEPAAVDEASETNTANPVSDAQRDRAAGGPRVETESALDPAADSGGRGEDEAIGEALASKGPADAARATGARVDDPLNALRIGAYLEVARGTR